MGDGELDEGSNWEASLAAAHYHLDNLIVIVDRNGLQITGPTETVNPLEPLDEKFRAFGYAVREVDGNDTQALVELFDQVPFEAGKPNLVLAHTIKGKGVSFIENSQKWHHRVPTDEEYDSALRELELDCELDEGEVIMELGRANLDVFAETLLELARQDRDVLVVTSDSRGSGKLTHFGETLPDQIVELGIAEQNVIGISAGLASAGKKVFAASPACFITARSFEQIKNDVAYSDQPVRIIGISAGVSYGALGATHHSLHDYAALRAIHNITIIAPADNLETRETIKAIYNAAHPVYVRLGKAPQRARTRRGQQLHHREGRADPGWA